MLGVGHICKNFVSFSFLALTSPGVLLELAFRCVFFESGMRAFDALIPLIDEQELLLGLGYLIDNSHEFLDHLELLSGDVF